MAVRATDVPSSNPTASNEAFDRLFVDQYRRVVAIAFRVLDDVTEAEDVAQEVFLAFHRSHDPEATYASAWLYRAASHLALNAVRSQKRRRHRERDDAMQASRLQATEGDPADQVTSHEEGRKVREVLARMPEKSATVLALRYSGLSYVEVAAALGCRVGQVGTLLRRAEARFRKELEREAH